MMHFGTFSSSSSEVYREFSFRKLEGSYDDSKENITAIKKYLETIGIDLNRVTNEKIEYEFVKVPWMSMPDLTLEKIATLILTFDKEIEPNLINFQYISQYISYEKNILKINLDLILREFPEESYVSPTNPYNYHRTESGKIAILFS